MAIARRQPRLSDAVRVPNLHFRDLRINFGTPDDPRIEINAEIEAPASSMNDIGALYEAGAILVGPKAALFGASPHSEMRIERSIDIAPPHFSRSPTLRASGCIIGEEDRIVILAHACSPYQRRPWRITIELDRGDRMPAPRHIGLGANAPRLSWAGY